MSIGKNLSDSSRRNRTAVLFRIDSVQLHIEVILETDLGFDGDGNSSHRSIVANW